MQRKPGMTSDELATAGRALYGDRWQTSLAHDLHVSDRTMRRWLTGEFPIPAGVVTELRAVLVERLNTIGGMVSYTVNPRDHTVFQAGRPAPVGGLHGFLRGSVVIPPEVDLTAPVTDEIFAADEGKLHR
jgi:hypothetical protein